MINTNGNQPAGGTAPAFALPNWAGPPPCQGADLMPVEPGTRMRRFRSAMTDLCAVMLAVAFTASSIAGMVLVLRWLYLATL